MKKAGSKRKIHFHKRIDSLIVAGLIAYMAGLLFRIPLTAVIGENGMGYFASVNEILMLCTIFITYGIAATVHSLIQYKLRREQYRGVQRILKYALLMTSGFGVAACILLFLLCGFVADIVLLERFSRLGIYMMAPSIVFCALTCLLRGYFQGIGSKIPTIHSVLLEKCLMLGLGLFFAVLFYNYGEKVAAIFQNDSYAAAYGAMGAFAGILLASLLSFLHLLFIYLLYSGTIKRQIYKDNTRNQDSIGYICNGILWPAVPYGICAVLYGLNTLADQRIYYYFMNLGNQEEIKAAAWGNYYGIYLAIIGILAACGCLIPGKAMKGITRAWMRDEQRFAREQMNQTFNKCIAVTIPMAIFATVLAEPLADIFMKGNSAISAGLIQWGSSLIVFGALGYLGIGILKQLNKIYQLLLIGVGTFAIHLVVLYFLLSKTGMGIHAVALSNVISGACVSFAGFGIVVRMMKYRKEWMRKCSRTLVITLITAGIAGLIAILLKTALLSLVGEIITILICLLIVIPVYIILMILLRGLTEDDLETMQGGMIIISIAKRLHLL